MSLPASWAAYPLWGTLTRREDCRRLVEFTVERFGGVDILANVAGVQHVCPIEEFPEDKWDFIISLMLTAPFLLTRYCWPYMKEKGWGRIINMRSIHGLVASEFKSAYVSRQARARWLYQDGSHGGWPPGHHLQCHLPGLCYDPLVEKQIAAQAQTHGIPEEKVISDIMLSKAAIKKMVPAENIGAIAEVSLLRCGSVHHRYRFAHRRRLDSQLNRLISLSFIDRPGAEAPGLVLYREVNHQI